MRLRTMMKFIFSSKEQNDLFCGKTEVYFTSNFPLSPVARGQCLVGSFSGALASKRVTEAFIKVGLGRMEIGLDV